MARVAIRGLCNVLRKTRSEVSTGFSSDSGPGKRARRSALFV